MLTIGCHLPPHPPSLCTVAASRRARMPMAGRTTEVIIPRGITKATTPGRITEATMPGWVIEGGTHKDHGQAQRTITAAKAEATPERRTAHKYSNAAGLVRL